MSKKELYSFHIFLFPFTWDLKGGMDSLDGLMLENWDHKKFGFENDSDSTEFYNRERKYSEFHYFYDFVRDVLYDQDDGNPKFLKHFQYKTGETGAGIYEIKIDGTTYTLGINSILVNYYDNGTGVLSFHLENRDYSKPQDILNINEFGRHIYPPYLIPGNDDPIPYNIVAKSVEVKIKDTSITEDWKTFKEKDQLPTKDYVPKFITGLFPQEIAKILKPVIDDRMFVVCWYGTDFESLNIIRGDWKKMGNFWGQYLLVDTAKDGSTSNPQILQSRIEKGTNAWWAEKGSLIGVSQYSFVMLTDGSPFSRDVLGGHLRTMYFKMVELCLVQRASLLKFSDEVTQITTQLKGSEKDNVSDKTYKLYQDYIRFINKIYFREVTAQDQGLDLYERLQNETRLPGHVKELEQEIAEIHSIISMKQEKKRNNQLDFITKAGAMFIGPSFLVGFFGMNVFEKSIIPLENCHLLFVLGMMVASTFLVWGILKMKKRKMNWFFWILLPAIAFFALFVLTYLKTFCQ